MKQSDSDIVCDFFTWHAGGGSYVLTDEYNNVSLEKKKHYICYFHYPKITQWFQNLTVLNSWFLIFICYVFIFSTFFVFEDFMISILEVYQMICVYLMVFFNLISRKRLPSKWPSQTRHLRRADSIMCCVNSSLSNSAYFDYIPWTFCTKLTFTIKLNLVVKFHCFC